MAAIIAAGVGAAGAIGSSLLAPSATKGPNISKIRSQASKTRAKLIGGETLSVGGQQVSLPGLNIASGLSNVDAGTGAVNIDPFGRDLRRNALGDFTANVGETRNSLLGNQNAFNQARVNPLMETLGRGRGELSRGLNRTGVRGTFRDRALQDFDIQGERALGDQRAIAEQESLTAINSIDQLMFNAQSGTATDSFNEELAALGFGLDTINVINTLANNLAVGAGSTAQRSAANESLVNQARTENITGAIGSGLAAFGGLSRSGAPPPTTSNPGSGQGVSSLFP
jgi:hypothetical protein